MHVLLAVSVILMVNQRPYISPVDQQVELFALLSLAAVSHVASIFKAGVMWHPVYLGLTIVVFALPIFTFGGGMVYLQRQAKAEIAHLVALEHTVEDAGRSFCCGNKKKRGTAVQQADEEGDVTKKAIDGGECEDVVNVESTFNPEATQAEQGLETGVQAVPETPPPRPSFVEDHVEAEMETILADVEEMEVVAEAEVAVEAATEPEP
jgi:hypothetical protein